MVQTSDERLIFETDQPLPATRDSTHVTRAKIFPESAPETTRQCRKYASKMMQKCHGHDTKMTHRQYKN